MDDLDHAPRQEPETGNPYAALKKRVRELEEESRRLKKENDDLKKINENYRAAQKSRTEFICRFLPDGTITFASDALARLINKNPQQLIHQNFYQYLPAAERDKVREKVNALCREIPVVELDERVAISDDEMIWLHWVNRVLRWENGRPAEIEGVGREVTEVKRAQESLKKIQQRFQYFLDTMDEGFIQANKDFINTYVNEKLCKMLGYEREELVGRTVVNFFDKKNKEILEKQLEKRKKGERGSYEITWKKKNGDDLHTLLSPAPLMDENGVFKGCYTVVTDVTRLKQAEQFLKDREKKLKQKRAELAEANTTLKTLLKVKDESIRELEEAIASNLRQMITPYLNKLKRKVDGKERAYVRIIESNLDKVVSPVIRKLSSHPRALTPAELEVASLVKDGNTSKEIANLLNVSRRTVDFHRRNIREKLGLINTRKNLRSHLMNFD